MTIYVNIVREFTETLPHTLPHSLITCTTTTFFFYECSQKKAEIYMENCAVFGSMPVYPSKWKIYVTVHAIIRLPFYLTIGDNNCVLVSRRLKLIFQGTRSVFFSLSFITFISFIAVVIAFKVIMYVTRDHILVFFHSISTSMI